MKKLMTVFLLVFALKSMAQVNPWFRFYPNPIIMHQQIQATVSNQTFYPLFCRGFVQGITGSGLRVTSWVNRWLAPGQFARVYVYNQRHFDPFINSYSEIFCRH